VLSLLRQALGTPTAPPNQVLIGLALFLTLFVMAPVLDHIYQEAWIPYSEDKIPLDQALAKGAQPLRGFMIRQTREQDLALMLEISRTPAPESVDKISSVHLIPAFMLSELKSAFQIGFAYWLLTRGIRGLPAVEVSLLLLAEPVLNTLWTWAVHGETPGNWSLAGCAVILAATCTRVLAQRGGD